MGSDTGDAQRGLNRIISAPFVSFSGVVSGAEDLQWLQPTAVGTGMKEGGRVLSRCLFAFKR